MPTHPYGTREYAETLAHAGWPLFVPAWQTHVIVREFAPGARDAIGPYPLAPIAPGSDLPAGARFLREAGLVSVAMVVDGSDSSVGAELTQAFTLVRPFKTHYLVDTAHAHYAPSPHHRYEIERAARRGVQVRPVALVDVLDDWIALYGELVERHRIGGVQRFPRASFEALARCPGLTTFAAFMGEDLLACHLWIQHLNMVWSHLAATNARGYAAGASYAIYDYSIRAFGPRTINLGGSAGVEESATDGLARFKAGFANRKQTSLLCGAILDPETYDSLCERHGNCDTEYFPRYRA